MPTTLRRTVDVVGALCAVALVAGVLYFANEGVRARVPVEINDRKALYLYTSVNGTNLDSIYAPAMPPKPIASDIKTPDGPDQAHAAAEPDNAPEHDTAPAAPKR